MSPDIIRLIALELKPTEFTKLCQTSFTFYTIICKAKSFWYQKLYRDFPDTKKFSITNPKLLYRDLVKVQTDGYVEDVLNLKIKEPLFRGLQWQINKPPENINYFDYYENPKYPEYETIMLTQAMKIILNTPLSHPVTLLIEYYEDVEGKNYPERSFEKVKVPSTEKYPTMMEVFNTIHNTYKTNPDMFSHIIFAAFEPHKNIYNGFWVEKPHQYFLQLK